MNHLCHTKYDTIYYSTILNDGAILTYLKRKGIVSPNKPTTYNPSLRTLQEEYAGLQGSTCAALRYLLRA